MSSQTTLEMKLDPDRVSVQRQEEPVFGDEPTNVTLETLSWEELSDADLSIEVRGISHTPDTENGSLRSVTLHVDSIEGNLTSSKDCDSVEEEIRSELGIDLSDRTRLNKTMYIQIFEYLVEQRHITPEELPYEPGGWYKRYLLNTQPRNKQGEKMNRPKPIGNGIYLATTFGSKDKLSNVRSAISDLCD